MVSTTPVANFATGTAGVVDTGGKFANGNSGYPPPPPPIHHAIVLLYWAAAHCSESLTSLAGLPRWRFTLWLWGKVKLFLYLDKFVQFLHLQTYRYIVQFGKFIGDGSMLWKYVKLLALKQFVKDPKRGEARYQSRASIVFSWFPGSGSWSSDSWIP